MKTIEIVNKILSPPHANHYKIFKNTKNELLNCINKLKKKKLIAKLFGMRHKIFKIKQRKGYSEPEKSCEKTLGGSRWVQGCLKIEFTGMAFK